MWRIKNNGGCLAVLLAAQLLLTQAKLLFFSYNMMQTTADSSEQRICAIKSASDEQLVRSREQFVARSRTDLRCCEQRRWVHLNRLASRKGECGRERGLPWSGQMSSTILTMMNGGVIFVWRQKTFDFVLELVEPGQQTGDSLWNLGFDLLLLCGGMLRQASFSQQAHLRKGRSARWIPISRWSKYICLLYMLQPSVLLIQADVKIFWI